MEKKLKPVLFSITGEVLIGWRRGFLQKIGLYKLRISLSQIPRYSTLIELVRPILENCFPHLMYEKILLFCEESRVNDFLFNIVLRRFKNDILIYSLTSETIF